MKSEIFSKKNAIHSIYIWCFLFSSLELLNGCTASYEIKNKTSTIDHIRITIHIPEGTHVYADSLRVISDTKSFIINNWQTEEKPILLYDAQRHVQTRCLQHTIHLTVDVEKKNRESSCDQALWISYTTNSDPSPACLCIPFNNLEKKSALPETSTSMKDYTLPFQQDDFFKRKNLEEKKQIKNPYNWCAIKEKYGIFFSFILFILMLWHILCITHTYIHNKVQKMYYWILLLRTYFLLMGIGTAPLFLRSLFFTGGTISGFYALKAQWKLASALFFIVSFTFVAIDILMSIQHWYCR